MKRFLIIIVSILLINSIAKAQFVKWTFEISVPNTAGPHAAEFGTGSASGFHTSSSVTFSNPVGNGSLESFSSNYWSVGDYYQFQFSATGYKDLIITWDATGSGTGPKDFKVQYSTDGTNFTNATGTNSTYSLTGETWSSSSYNAASTRSLDLSSVTALNNATTVYIRLVSVNTTSINGGTVATNGTSRVDNFQVDGSYINPSTDYFRSAQSGNWNDISTWESSSDNITWNPAVQSPTSAANIILIRNGHTVTINGTASADQLIIQSGGILDYTAGTFTIEDGTGDDVDIESSGVFQLAFASNPPSFGSGNPTVNVRTNGILRVAAGGMTGAGTGVNANNYIYNDLSILEYTAIGGFSTNNVTYFPNVNATTIPIFRVTNPSGSNLLVGAGNPTTFNGIFEYTNLTHNIIWQNAGDKIFRNGIRGNGSVTANASADNAKFIINGETAELGGTGTLQVPTNGGLEIGSASNNTVVSVTSDKTVTGDISLLSTNNTYVDLGTNNLTVTGTVSGGTATSYIRTTSTGELKLANVNAAGKTFPVGDSKYNPIIIENGNNETWSVNANDGIVPDATSTTDGAVLITWHITPTTVPFPLPGADITFQFDPTTQVGSLYDTPPYNSPDNLQAWHQKNGYWLASGIASVVMHLSSSVATLKSTGLTEFSPYGLSRIWLPLPIKLIDFTVTKISSGVASIHWELAECCAADASFVIEKSTDSRNFSAIGTVGGNPVSRLYQYEDNHLAKGISYYRLRMKDVDGSIQYSKIIAVVNGEKGIVINAIAPNPVVQTADISISAGQSGVLQFRLFDMLGHIVRQWQTAVSSGTNHVPLNAEGLSGGIYTVQVMGNDGMQTFRFVKQ